MKPYFANLINSLLLISLGLWGYFGSVTPSPTALIPVFSGFILFILYPWFKKGNSIVAHIAVGLTFLLFIALIKPLTGALGKGDSAAVIRVIVMMISNLLALLVFIKSFVVARTKKE
jgi:hypothetical protein